jgi:hypothetical protein
LIAMITSRREFLGGVGSTLGRAALGFALMRQLGIAEESALALSERLRFGALDPLVDLMQETPADALMPILVNKLRSGTRLEDLVGAGALANARAYGGTNYNGYHTLMAMMPSYEMALALPAPYSALPVLKVLHRNARFFQETGRAKTDALEPLAIADAHGDLVQSIRSRDLPKAEQCLAAVDGRSPALAYEELQHAVRDDMNVHRVVLAWRAFDLLRVTGTDQSLTMLRQSVRFCIDENSARVSRGQPPSEITTILPELMAKHALEKHELGRRVATSADIERWSDALYGADRANAAAAAAQALADGYDSRGICEAMSLAAVRLLLHDPGRAAEEPGKPVGSVHGASIGVHASDAANAWRRIAFTGSAPNHFANIIAGAYHTAGQSSRMSAEPFDHDAEPCTKSDPADLRAEIDARIRARDQKHACRATRRYCELGHSSPELFALLLGFAVSEDGALHAEKYFRTATEEHAAARDEFKPLYLVALTRVMASQQGFPAPGVEETRKLLSA